MDTNGPSETAMAEPLYGWFDDPGPVPAYEPPHDAPCPYCGLPCTDDDVRTHSFMREDKRTRSYFYRTHISCDDHASQNEKDSIFEGVLAQITIKEGEPP
jgi:hypothetical protein